MIMHLAVSPMPIGHTPGFLLNAISLLAMRGAIDFGSTRQIQRHFAVAAREFFRGHLKLC